MIYDERVYNFSAGPSMLPIDVLEKVKNNITNYQNSGMSVMEMSHRSKTFVDIAKEAEANLRTLMEIPDNYEVLFLQGGGTLQFSMIPLNLMGDRKKADYIVTGSWADKAAKEAIKFGDIKILGSSKDKNYTYIPKIEKGDIREDAAYVYVCLNNTIYGSKFHELPDTGNVPLVGDWSSGILSERIDVSKFGLIFAGAQKNIGPAGMTIVIVKKDLMKPVPKNTPVYLDYKIHVENESMYNTPPTFSIYVAGEVFKYLKERGGVRAQEAINKEKAEKLYQFIDGSSLYNCPVEKTDRSLMNIVFVTGNEDLDKKFIEEAKTEGLLELGGHRSIGGMRASIYNAMPMEGIDKLISFMKNFEEQNI